MMDLGRTHARRRLDKQLDQFRRLANEPRPHRGWIRAIRDALGMSSTELAHRMRVSQSRIPEIERAEVSGALRLETLERAAEALGCQVTYALVPRTSLEHTVQQQALRKAAAQLAAVGVAHNMQIEDQAITGIEFTEQIVDLATELVDKRGLW